jgi:hypothetical protein
LQERSQLALAEVQSHYKKGQELMAEKSFEFAVAEFQEALKSIKLPGSPPVPPVKPSRR